MIMTVISIFSSGLKKEGRGANYREYGNLFATRLLKWMLCDFAWNKIFLAKFHWKSTERGRRIKKKKERKKRGEKKRLAKGNWRCLFIEKNI